MPSCDAPPGCVSADIPAFAWMGRYTYNVKRGKLIAFEGIDGCGKSTQLEMLAGALRGRGIDVVATREPTAGEHGQRIRAMAQSGERVDPKQELEWFVLDRREHVASVIEPGLAAGRVVLTDRYYLSSVAYQGARGLDAKSILADSEAEFPLPDLVVVIEIDPEKGLARVGARGGVAEPVFEEIDFQRRVAEQFAALGCAYLMRVPGDGAPEAVHRRVAEIVLARLGLETSA